MPAVRDSARVRGSERVVFIIRIAVVRITFLIWSQRLTGCLGGRKKPDRVALTSSRKSG